MLDPLLATKLHKAVRTPVPMARKRMQFPDIWDVLRTSQEVTRKSNLEKGAKTCKFSRRKMA